MQTSPEITIDMTAEELLQEGSDAECFEVDDIAALDPVGAPLPPVAKATTPAAATPSPDDEMSLEIELSADDMNAMFDAETTDKLA